MPIPRMPPKMLVSRGIVKIAMQAGLLFLVTTMLTMIHLSRSQQQKFDDDHTALEQRKTQVLDTLRQERLRELQKTVFKHNKRPPDERYNINVTLSDHIPLERDIIDSRSAECRAVKYDTTGFPTVTIIIPFYNEALSMLLRAVHSILLRTPAHLLKEIILINDHSPNEDLSQPLESYIKLLPKVHLVRTTQREGLIRARMIGAGMAKGDVLMFQDAHTENNRGWLEPLLQEIHKNPSTVIQPHVDGIDQWTIQYQASHGAVPRGGFSWDLRYVWMELPKHEKQRLGGDAARAQRTPTLVGCALAVRRDYFLAIGGFDDGMNVWGGENIELAFRTWMCHGQVLNHPCSRIGHVFKPFSYSFDGDREKIVQKNLMRLAELWMDDWKKFFLAATYTWEFKRTYLTKSERESLKKRQIMKKKLQCKPFKWYMETIVPEMPTPPMEAVYYGEITNLRSEACFEEKADGYIGMTYFCFFHRVLPQNLFYIDVDGRLKHDGKCIRLVGNIHLIKIGPCLEDTSTEKWWVDPTSFYEGRLKVTFIDHKKEYTMCVTQVTNMVAAHEKEQMPQVMECSDQNEFQTWRFQYKFDFKYNFDPPANEK